MSKYEFSPSDAEVQRIAAMFKALSNPHRLRIYTTMANCCQGDVFTQPEDEAQNCQRQYAEDLGLAPSTVSHHFKELRQAGLIHVERKGKNVSFWVDQEAAKLMKDFMA